MSVYLAETAVLRSLLHAPSTGRTVSELRQRTGYAESSIRNNLAVWQSLSPPWVASNGRRPARWMLTDKGRDVCAARGLS